MLTAALHLADVSKASARMKGGFPGLGRDAEKKGETWASEAGAKIDSAVRDPHATSRVSAITSSNPIQRNTLSFAQPDV